MYKKYQLWPEEIGILIIHKDRRIARRISKELNQMFPGRIVESRIIDQDLEYLILHSIMSDMIPEVLIIGDLETFPSHESFGRSTEPIALLADRMYANTIVIKYSAEQVEPIVGVDVYYVEGDPYGEILNRILDVDENDSD